MPEVPALFTVVLLSFWCVADVFVAWAAVRALRATAAGILLGSAFALEAVRTMTFLISEPLLRDAPFDAPGRVWVFLITSILGIVLRLACIVGVAFIPTSLRRLRAGRAQRLQSGA